MPRTSIIRVQITADMPYDAKTWGATAAAEECVTNFQAAVQSAANQAGLRVTAFVPSKTSVAAAAASVPRLPTDNANALAERLAAVPRK